MAELAAIRQKIWVWVDKTKKPQKAKKTKIAKLAGIRQKV